MKKVIVIRDTFFSDKATLGTCYVLDENNEQIFKSECLERGWVDNRRNLSCIPSGNYPLVLEYSPRFRKNLWEIKEVENRSECKFHSANYWHQLNGCIALGRNRKYIDGDLILDVTSSNNTMSEFHKALKGYSKLSLTVIDIRQV